MYNGWFAQECYLVGGYQEFLPIFLGFIDLSERNVRYFLSTIIVSWPAFKLVALLKNSYCYVSQYSEGLVIAVAILGFLN